MAKGFAVSAPGKEQPDLGGVWMLPRPLDSMGNNRSFFQSPQIFNGQDIVGAPEEMAKMGCSLGLFRRLLHSCRIGNSRLQLGAYVPLGLGLLQPAGQLAEFIYIA